ncbi:MAG: hypothetical protein PHX07_01210 [Candidatus Marinimicrobia bacterium]|jgi:hypothetical protein|nr:hypothetical protein [Candidatus Neomarinimicrobiota bacterium]MDD4960834.1 hypothetical protein [Candidatus Neomarinimicrobiota bacterium]MDX9778144.1 hypothetical protein [bacterium]
MEKRLFFLLQCLGTLLFGLPQAWINEVHYDNTGTDVDEFVEVVVACPENCSLGDLTLYMYNGFDGRPYCLECVIDFVPGERIGPYQFYTWYQGGIQNDMEGMILVYHDTLVDIIAYEGSFYGTHEPALGLLFPDVGVAETASSPLGGSIYLSGFPGDPWVYSTEATPGNPNPGQVLDEVPTPVRVSQFTAEMNTKSVVLRWRSETELENACWHLYRNGDLLHSCEGAGTVNHPVEYVFQDKTVRSATRYRYVLSHCDYGGREIFLDSLRIVTTAGNNHSPLFRLNLPFPNPCNPQSTLNLKIEEALQLEILLYDLCGRRVREIFRGKCRAGEVTIPITFENLPSGRYILLCSSDYQREYRMITLLK